MSVRKKYNRLKIAEIIEKIYKEVESRIGKVN